MRRTFFTELLFQVFALIVLVILVHAYYVTTVRPNATAVLEEQALRIQQEENYTPERSFWVLIRDIEQESCFILMFWAFAIMGYKAVFMFNERKLLQLEFLPVQEGVRILPEDTREYGRAIESLSDRIRSMLLPRVLLSSLERFGSTRNVQDVSSVANSLCEARSGAARIGTVNDPLYRLGDSFGRVHRHRQGYRPGGLAKRNGLSRATSPASPKTSVSRSTRPSLRC